MKESRFLTQRDVEKEVLVTIKSCEQTNVAKEGADPEYRWTLSFHEFEKPMTLNWTNGQIIAAITGSEDTDDWIGKKVVLYKEPNVFFGNKMVGGIRVRAPKTKPIPKPLPTNPEVNHSELRDALTEDLTAGETTEDDIPF